MCQQTRNGTNGCYNQGETMRRRERVRIGVILCLAALWGSGCSAFRWGERSYQEVEQQNEAQRELEKRFNPDEVFERK
jgi:hypothetical protein